MPVRTVRGFVTDPSRVTPPPSRPAASPPTYLPFHPQAIGSNTFRNRLTCRLKGEHLWALTSLDLSARVASFLCTRCTRTLVSDASQSSLLFDPPTAFQAEGRQPDNEPPSPDWIQGTPV